MVLWKCAVTTTRRTWSKTSGGFVLERASMPYMPHVRVAMVWCAKSHGNALAGRQKRNVALTSSMRDLNVFGNWGHAQQPSLPSTCGCFREMSGRHIWNGWEYVDGVFPLEESIAPIRRHILCCPVDKYPSQHQPTDCWCHHIVYSETDKISLFCPLHSCLCRVVCCCCTDSNCCCAHVHIFIITMVVFMCICSSNYRLW